MHLTPEEVYSCWAISDFCLSQSPPQLHGALRVLRALITGDQSIRSSRLLPEFSVKTRLKISKIILDYNLDVSEAESYLNKAVSEHRFLFLFLFLFIFT